MRFFLTNLFRTYFTREILFYIILLLPLCVFFLPRFQTTYVEDLVLLALFLYWGLRVLNNKRRSLSLDFQPLFLSLIAGTIYTIAWMGLMRAYLQQGGRLIAVFPLLLVLALYFRPTPRLPNSPAYRTLLLILFVLTLLFFTLAALFFLVQLFTPLPEGRFDTSGIIPSLLVFPILGCISISLRSHAPLNTTTAHLPLLIILSLTAFLPWKENYHTWRDWYAAGVSERAWTPYKFEPISDAERELYHAAVQKPAEAATYYFQVLNQIEKKGDLPRYFNWPFFMRYRMAYNAMRMEDPKSALTFLPPSQVKQEPFIEKLKYLWYFQFIWPMQQTEPTYTFQHGIWRDAEWDPASQTLLTLDRWGRVYYLLGGRVIIDWEPEATFQDAIDLLFYNEIYYVLRRHGQIYSSQGEYYELNPTREYIDMEIDPNTDTLLITDRYGKIHSPNQEVNSLPSWENLYFNQPVIADMEIDPDGRGYYLLDIHGAIHANHHEDSPTLPYQSPHVPDSMLPYWTNQDMAIDLELDTEQECIYIYNRLGEIFLVTPKPHRETYRPPQTYPQRGVDLTCDPQSHLHLFESNGHVETLP